MYVYIYIYTHVQSTCMHYMAKLAAKSQPP